MTVDTTPARLAALMDALKSAEVTIENLLSVMATPDQRQCCDGQMCGCMGSTVYQEAEFYARQDIKTIAAARDLVPALAARVAELEAKLAQQRLIEDAYCELIATVRGECPSLINEDSGGSAVLIDLILKAEGVTK